MPLQPADPGCLCYQQTRDPRMPSIPGPLRVSLCFLGDFSFITTTSILDSTHYSYRCIDRQSPLLLWSERLPRSGFLFCLNCMFPAEPQRYCDRPAAVVSRPCFSVRRTVFVPPARGDQYFSLGVPQASDTCVACLDIYPHIVMLLLPVLAACETFFLRGSTSPSGLLASRGEWNCISNGDALVWVI